MIRITKIEIPDAGDLPFPLLCMRQVWRNQNCDSHCDTTDYVSHSVLLSLTENHSITLSAHIKTFEGIATPSLLAVFRLITSSNFVGCSTGKSAGLAPLRILST